MTHKLHLIPAAQAGDEDAMREVIEANYGLVRTALNRYYHNLNPEDAKDLMQEGYFALRRAVELYDPTKNTKFSTYAVGWVRGKMARYLDDNAGPVRVPIYLQERYRKKDEYPHTLAVGYWKSDPKGGDSDEQRTERVELGQESFETQSDISSELEYALEGVRPATRYALLSGWLTMSQNDPRRREICNELGLKRNTVSKYIAQDLEMVRKKQVEF